MSKLPPASGDRSGRGLGNHAPGLATALLGAGLATALAAPVEAVSALPVAVVLGMLVGNTVRLPDRLRPGLQTASRRLLRAGIVLLGLRLALGDVAALGLPALGVVVAVSAATLAGVAALARAAGLRSDLGLLTGAGFAICGASAVAAAQSVLAADEEHVASAMANVMAFGTLSIVVLPLVAALLGMPDPLAGAWFGASVHDVGQTVATAGSVSEAALEAAVVVKLTRVLLLGPVLVTLGLLVRRRGALPGGQRPALVPAFVVAFVAASLLRTSGLVPDTALVAAGWLEQAMFGAALVALGTEVRWARLRGLGLRPLLVGALAWALIALLALAGVHLALPA